MTTPKATAAAGAGTATPSGVAATARGGWWGFLGAATNALFGFVLVALVTRVVGARGAGAVFTGVAVFTILSHACKLGADTGLVRFVSRDLATVGGRRVGALLRTAVVPGAVAATAAAAVLFLSPTLSTTLLPNFPPHEALRLVRLFALFLPLATVAMLLLGATRGYGTVVPFVGVEQIGKPVLRVLIALPAALLAPGVLTMATAWLLPSLAGAVVAWVALRRCRATQAEPWEPKAAGAGREFWAFSAPRAISSMFDISAVWIGVILLSALGTSEEAGVYTAVGRIVTAGTLVQLAIRLAVGPELSRLLSLGESAQARDLYRLATRWIVLFSWPLFILLGCFPGTMMAVFGSGFHQGAAALVILCLAAALNVSVGDAQTVMLMAGKSSWHLAVTGAAFVVHVVVGVLLVPYLGVVGAALAWGLAILIENLASAALVGRRMGFAPIDRGYRAAARLGLTATASLVLPVRLFAGDTVLGLAVGITLTICAFSVGFSRNRMTLGVSELFGVLRKRATGAP